jgi:hypothetical protein
MKRGGVLQSFGLGDDLLDIHRNRRTFGDAARQCAGLGGLGDAPAGLADGESP